MDTSTSTRTRGPSRIPRPGRSKAARALFLLYYCGPEGLTRRARLIERFAGEGGLERRAAVDKLGKYARGDRTPEPTWRRLLSKVANIPQRDWDEVAA